MKRTKLCVCFLLFLLVTGCSYSGEIQCENLTSNINSKSIMLTNDGIWFKNNEGKLVLINNANKCVVTYK